MKFQLGLSCFTLEKITHSPPFFLFLFSYTLPPFIFTLLFLFPFCVPPPFSSPFSLSLLLLLMFLLFPSISPLFLLLLIMYLSHKAKWKGHWTRSEGLGFDFQCWLCVQVSGKLRILHSLGPNSYNGYLVHRSEVGSIVAGCIGTHLTRGKVKSEEHG